jgi:hypothetical protein
MEASQGLILPAQRRKQGIAHFKTEDNVGNSYSYRKYNIKKGSFLDKGQSRRSLIPVGITTNVFSQETAFRTTSVFD